MMAAQFVLNLGIALVWLLLGDEWKPSGFIIGYLIGLSLIFFMRRFWTQPFYLVKVWAVVKLLGLFLKELVLSNLAVIRHIIRPKLNIRPGIFAFTTELKSDWEVTLLACLITLTPGTLTLEVSEDQRTLYIHAMDIEDAESLGEQIKGSFERAIMEVTR